MSARDAQVRARVGALKDIFTTARKVRGDKFALVLGTLANLQSIARLVTPDECSPLLAMALAEVHKAVTGAVLELAALPEDSYAELLALLKTIEQRMVIMEDSK